MRFGGQKRRFAATCAGAGRDGDDRSVKIRSLEAAKIMKIKWLVLGGGGGRPDYLQKLKVPEGYEKMIDCIII